MDGSRFALHSALQVRQRLDPFRYGGPGRPLQYATEEEIYEWLRNPDASPATYPEVLTEYLTRRGRLSDTDRPDRVRPRLARTARLSRDRRARSRRNSPSQNVRGEN